MPLAPSAIVARVMADGDDVVIEHPNRRKATSKLTRLLVIVLLLASAALVLIVTLGGWSALESARLFQIVFILVDVVFAAFVARWSRGVLPMAAAIAVLLGIFAAVAAPAWFSRDNPGFTDPAISSGVLGLLCALLIPVQVALIVFAMQGFRQRWNVEVERRRREPAHA
jgi:lysylphosphatidylglycerol synthetase-like protein (DUF2156 family)